MTLSDMPAPSFAVLPAGPGGAVVVAAAGELDLAVADRLRETLAAALDAADGRVVVDLSAVTFLDSVALAVLLRAATRHAREGRLPVVLEPGSYARLVFDAVGTPAALPVHADRHAALAGLAPAAAAPAH